MTICSVADPCKLIRIRIQDLNKFVTDPDLDRTLTSIRIQAKTMRRSRDPGKLYGSGGGSGICFQNKTILRNHSTSSFFPYFGSASTCVLLIRLRLGSITYNNIVFLFTEKLSCTKKFFRSFDPPALMKSGWSGSRSSLHQQTTSPSECGSPARSPLSALARARNIFLFGEVKTTLRFFWPHKPIIMEGARFSSSGTLQNV